MNAGSMFIWFLLIKNKANFCNLLTIILNKHSIDSLKHKNSEQVKFLKIVANVNNPFLKVF